MKRGNLAPEPTNDPSTWTVYSCVDDSRDDLPIFFTDPEAHIAHYRPFVDAPVEFNRAVCRDDGRFVVRNSGPTWAYPYDVNTDEEAVHALFHQRPGELRLVSTFEKT